MNLKNIFTKKQEKRGLSYVTPYTDALLFGTYSDYNPLSLSAVFRAIELISDSLAILPIKISAKNEKGVRQNIENHPILKAFTNRNSLTTSYTLLKNMVSDMLRFGNGYAYITRNGKNIISIDYISAQDITINFNKFNGTVIYTICNHKGLGQVSPENILHILKNSYDGVQGIGVISFAKRTLTTAQSNENCAKNFFSNGMNMSGILTVNGNLTEEQKSQIRSSWSQAYNGESSGLAVLQGNMTYQPIQSSASDSQMLESRIFNVEEIARFFGISPILLGDLSNSSYSTIEAAQLQFLVQTLQPYITLIEKEFTKKLCVEYDNVEINLDENYILRSDKSAQASYYNTLLNNGTLSINEVRKELGYAEIDGGDEHHIAYNSTENSAISQPEKNDTKNQKIRKKNV